MASSASFWLRLWTLWSLVRFKSVPTRGATSSSFRGEQFSWTFIRWRHRAYSTVVQLFRKWSNIIFYSQHFRKR